MNAAYVISKNISVFTKSTKKSPIIEISCGPVQGIISTSRDGRKYSQYLGIPYAKPPVQQLRFEAPEPWTEKWTGVRDASKNGAKAVQFDALSQKVIGDEDCLFLDVHTPVFGIDLNLPVLVWFHGGSFILGSGNDYKPDYFMEHDIIVVSINYRLGCFGFLDTGDGVVRGNMGLKDQNMALRWVQNNIARFGGNPNDVTIAGESAGGASVHFHVLSKMSKGLFHKAISQSGLATLPFSMHTNPRRLSRKFGEMLNCTIDDTTQMVKQLKTLEAATLASVQLGMFDNFRPTIEIDFEDNQAIITKDPQEIIDSGNFNKVPYLVGVNSGEGILLATPVLTNKTTPSELDKEWGKTLAQFLFFPDDVDPTILDPTKELYFTDGFEHTKPMDYMQGMANLFSDRIWNHCFHSAMTSHAVQLMKSGEEEVNPLFIYYYDYHGKYSLADMVLAIGGDLHPLLELIKIKGSKFIKEKIKNEEIPKYGSCHGDGLSMQWYMPSMCYVPKKSPDYEISKEIVQSLVQFTKLSKRTPSAKALKFSNKDWIPQKGDKALEYMHICKEPKMIPEPFTERLHFWKQIQKTFLSK